VVEDPAPGEGSGSGRERVEQHRGVPAALQRSRRHSADITGTPGQQNLHALTLLIPGPRPGGSGRHGPRPSPHAVERSIVRLARAPHRSPVAANAGLYGPHGCPSTPGRRERYVVRPPPARTLSYTEELAILPHNSAFAM